ncbi:MAG: type III PLP-dependent enzyme, partial [Deltaproteobacteria bacterium]|nr:type III PLP-dependent enzyme [Deltaproteobacteria bacterium]
MPIKLEEYIDPDTFEKILAFSKNKETPFLVIDTATVMAKLEELEKLFPYARVYYAVKANPAIEILTMMKGKNINFDIASIFELDRALSLGISPDRICFGNTIKKSKDVRYFYEKGVRMFATDSEADIRSIAKAAPGSRVYVRILTEGTYTADWPLSRKFGCQSDMAMDLIILAKDLGLIPYG